MAKNKVPPLNQWLTFAGDSYQWIARDNRSEERPSDMRAFYIDPMSNQRGKVIGWSMREWDSNNGGHRPVASFKTKSAALKHVREIMGTGRAPKPTRLQKMGAGMKARHPGYADNPARVSEIMARDFHPMRGHVEDGARIKFDDGYSATLVNKMKGWTLVSDAGRELFAPVNNATVVAQEIHRLNNYHDASRAHEENALQNRRGKNPDTIHIDVNSHNTKGRNVRAKNPGKMIKWPDSIRRFMDDELYYAKTGKYAPAYLIQNRAPELTRFLAKSREYAKAYDSLLKDAWRGRKENPSDNYADDSAEARELFLFATNDAGLYKRNIIPAIENLAKKMAKGQYDPAKAAKLFEYTANFAADEYAKQHGARGQKGHEIFKPADRRIVAREFVDYYAEDIASRAQEIAAKPRRKNPATIGTKTRNPHNVILRAYNRATGKTGYWTGEAWDTEKRKARKIGALAGIQGAMTIARKLADAMPDGWHIEVLEA